LLGITGVKGMMEEGNSMKITEKSLKSKRTEQEETKARKKVKIDFELLPTYGNLNDRDRVRRIVTQGIPFAERNFTIEKSPTFKAEAAAFARKLLDDFTGLQYEYIRSDFWLKFCSYEDLMANEDLPKDMDFHYIRPLDINKRDELLIRMNCRGLIRPQDHRIKSTGFRIVGFGRLEAHLYGNLFGYGVNSPLAKRKEQDLLRWCFCEDPNFFNKSFDISHLCHNNWCHNWRHVVLELNEKNKSRNGCPGGPLCQHQNFICRRPGTYCAL